MAREQSARLLNELRALGVTCHLVSGDTPATVGWWADHFQIPRREGGVTPEGKREYVARLQRGGAVVLAVGDGINDAPALRAADIGISVDSAVDIAKEAADLILLEKSLMVLEEGVIEGRRTFSNMLKYIRMTASSNFGSVFSVLVASAFLPFAGRNKAIFGGV